MRLFLALRGERVLPALLFGYHRAMIGFGRRMLEWLRAHNPTVDDGKRIVRKADRGEPPPDIDQIEELVRIIGEAPGGPLRRGEPTSARRVRRHSR
jgi:hypothetical protein